MALPAYDQCIKASHAFNLLDARGVISVTERQSYILRVRELAKACGARLAEDGRRRGRMSPLADTRFDSRHGRACPGHRRCLACALLGSGRERDRAAYEGRDKPGHDAPAPF